MPQQIIERGKTFMAIRVPNGELEVLYRDIKAQLQHQEYMVMEVSDGDHMIVIVTLVSTTPGSQQAFNDMAKRYGDTSTMRTVADNPAMKSVEIDFWMDIDPKQIDAFATVTVPENRVEAAENYIVQRARERIPVEGLHLIFIREKQPDGQVQIVAIPCFDRPVEIGKDGRLKRELEQVSRETADAFRPESHLKEGKADISVDF